ncbi:MAG: glycosyltransferase [Pyrinomonadaceae bacterium]
MKKIMVYSHDTYGLGNLRRMLSICQYLTVSIPDLTILLVSGSPMVHGFRLPDRVDYIKLPCLTRRNREEYAVKFLGFGLNEAIGLRSDLILAAATHFKPDLFLVDKKPFGVKNELEAALRYIKERLPETKKVLVLRDILDEPEATIQVWEKHHYHDVIQAHYDRVLILGVPEIFDSSTEYRFPDAVAAKVKFCGYIRREHGRRSGDEIRQELGIAHHGRLVLVMSGGGEDGYALLAAYLQGLASLPSVYQFHSLIVCGPEMIASQRNELSQAAAGNSRVSILEFTEDPMSYMSAADVVISMGGYNTICEILSLHKRAVIVPRARPVHEQWIRAQRLGERGLFKVIHPDDLSPDELMRCLAAQLDAPQNSVHAEANVDLEALPRMVKVISDLLFTSEKMGTAQNL